MLLEDMPVVAFNDSAMPGYRIAPSCRLTVNSQQSTVNGVWASLIPSLKYWVFPTPFYKFLLYKSYSFTPHLRIYLAFVINDLTTDNGGFSPAGEVPAFKGTPTTFG